MGTDKWSLMDSNEPVYALDGVAEVGGEAEKPVMVGPPAEQRTAGVVAGRTRKAILGSI